MKTSLLTIVLAIAAFQTAPPVVPERGQASVRPQATPLSAAECKCAIEITVKRQSTGEALSDVEITATLRPTPIGVDAAGRAQFANSANANPLPLTEFTDSEGRVAFRNLAEGTYSIQAQRDGFFGPMTNGIAPNAINVTVRVGPASAGIPAAAVGPTVINGSIALPGLILAPQPVQQLALTMIEGGIISGKIQDANHRPVTGVQIGAFRVGYRNGQRALNQTGSQVQTDDRGEYRMYWFPPGEYYIRTLSLPSRLSRNQNYVALTYYPGTLDPTQAVPVTIHEGQKLEGSDFTVQQTSGVTISGTITNTVPGGRMNPNGEIYRGIASVYLVPRNPVFLDNAPLIANIGSSATGNNPGTESAFEIRGVPSGSYDFYPIFNSPSANSPTGYFSGHTAIEVGSENISGIQTVIRPGVDLKGHLSIVGIPPASTPTPPVNFANVRVQLGLRSNLPTLVGAGAASSVSVDVNGNFAVLNLIDARYFVSNVLGLPTDAYLSEMRQGTKEIDDDGGFSIGESAADPLEVVVSRGGGTIQGTVQGAQNNPAPGVRVFLIPDAPRRQNIVLYKTAGSNAMGVFTMSGIAPGAYTLFAWTDIPQGAEQNREFLAEYEQLGVRILVSPGLAAANIQVPLISLKRY